jgi:hypothetical protein
MHPPRSAPIDIASVLGGCLDRVAGEPGAAAIWRAWEDAVGAQIARRAEPVRLRGRTLIVSVSSAPWMQELQLLKPQIRGELNARLPTALVDDLFFVLTEGRDTTPPPRSDAPPARCPKPPANVDLGGLPDPLRASFRALFEAWHRRARLA